MKKKISATIKARRIKQRIDYRIKTLQSKTKTFKSSNISKMTMKELKRFAKKRDKSFKKYDQAYRDAKYDLLNKPPESPFKSKTDIMNPLIKWNKKQLQKAVIEREKDFIEFLSDRGIEDEARLNDDDQVRLLVLTNEFLKYAESGEREEWFNENWYQDKQNDLMNQITDTKKRIRSK